MAQEKNSQSLVKDLLLLFNNRIFGLLITCRWLRGFTDSFFFVTENGGVKGSRTANIEKHQGRFDLQIVLSVCHS
jgi:hypothetical protein